MGLFEDMLQRDKSAPIPYTRRIGDWTTSLPHLKLLGCFIQPRSLQLPDAKWQQALGEPLADALMRFVTHGQLIPASPQQKMLNACTCVVLRQMLRARKLPSSGYKTTLVQRLLAADENGMKQFCDTLPIYVCSEEVKAHLIRFWQSQSDS